RSNLQVIESPSGSEMDQPSAVVSGEDPEGVTAANAEIVGARFEGGACTQDDTIKAPTAVATGSVFNFILLLLPWAELPIERECLAVSRAPTSATMEDSTCLTLRLVAR
ncbi:MAG: hypothetical protein KDB24_06365, partial [Microthrixaceae bacterium]|nr:hypothetical protein [Microthrixaceae bacterium]